MTLARLGIAAERIAGAVPAWRLRVDAERWRTLAEQMHADGARLAAMWAADGNHGGACTLRALYVVLEGVLVIELPAAPPAATYPEISDLFACAGRMQRAIFDLSGARALARTGEVPDARPWLRHNAWPADVHPLRREYTLAQAHARGDERYAFVPVDGEGVHEIPVGPVHAGIIEPGHFRFAVVGERVLRLEERLGYKHKGIEKRFEALTLAEGYRLAGRVSGDSTVAYAWAYAMALEGMAGCAPPERAVYLRALFLERERIANHLGDLGYLGNDGGLAFGLAQFSRLKEDLLRSNAALFGHRYLMDRVVPGGVAVDVAPPAAERILAECDGLEAELRTLRAIYYDHAGLQDRCISCGILAPVTAGRLGVVGVAARASGHAIDLRAFPGHAPYDELQPRLATHRNGDVAARIVVRFDEILESLRLQRRILRKLPAGSIAVAPGAAPEGAFGIGWIEGWRGELFVALEAGPQGGIGRCHAHDPSWQNWPALEHAIIGNIVPDFPLINKSFNLSYAGHDL